MKSTISKIFQLLLLAFSFHACTKDSPSTPVEPVKYNYMLENISDGTITTYNSDPLKPKENYKEITLSPSQKATIKILSETGTTPTIRPSDPLAQTEFTYDLATKTYFLDSYMNQVEVVISGDVENINIFFPNLVTGLLDSLINVKLPQTIKYNKIANEVIIIVQKQQVSGSFTLKTLLKGKEVYSKIVSAPFGKITAKTKAGEKTVSATVFEPEEWPCGTHKGNQLITGPKGGCYYINSNRNKVYVDRSECSCK